MMIMDALLNELDFPIITIPSFSKVNMYFLAIILSINLIYCICFILIFKYFFNFILHKLCLNLFIHNFQERVDIEFPITNIFVPHFKNHIEIHT